MLVYHNIARSCAAYTVFYGAMAGQELIALRQKVGSRKFQPTLEESMPWLSRSTAYLYIDYAIKLDARVRAICPAVGHIELAALPDPRDYKATESTALFAQVRDKTGIQSADQLWLALGLAREAKQRGGDTSKSRKPKLTKTRDEIAREEAQITYLPLQKALMGVLQAKAKRRLLFLPVTAPASEASLTVLRDNLEALSHLAGAAIKEIGRRP